MRNLKRKLVAVAMIAATSGSVVAVSGAGASSDGAKDTTWGCPGCVTTHR